MPTSDELIRLTAFEMVQLLRRRAVSPVEALEAAIARTEAVDGRVNAMPIKGYDRAREAASRMTEAGGPETSLLAGLPIAIKDLVDVAGLATTYGCPLYTDNIAQRSDPLVERLEARGAVVVGKTNTPELGMLPVTDNRVFGPTRNPWSTDRTPGGSSGGAAAAVVTGQVWLAHGTDVGGSLRIPAALSGCVGFRPSPGVVPRGPQKRLFSPFSLGGPMARTVADTALFLDAMAGYSHADPWSVPAPARSYLAAVLDARPPLRVAFTPDLGLGPADPEVAEIAQAAALRFQQAGTVVDLARPDFTGADRAYLDLLAINYMTERAEFVRANADALEPMHMALIRHGEGMGIEDLLAAERRRAEIFTDLARFFETYELLLTPTVGAAAFDVTRRGMEAADVDGWVAGGPPAWFHQCWATVLTSCPAISIPCGFTRGGLPVGLQLIGPVRGDAAVLAGAAVAEALQEMPTNRPIDPRDPMFI
ncbi:MAG TPA: amidase [Azospirillaceae bacterium]|nr:amidase [Azospirillaceae bacterium]